MIDTLNYHRSEAALYGRYIKYTRFSEIIDYELGDQTFNDINIFIDMTQMLTCIYRFDSISDPLGLLATMINLPLHYRNFFNRINVRSNIFVIYSTNDSVNNYRFLASYDHKHKMLRENNAAVADTIDHNIELMSTICPYLPGIYMKRGTVEPTVIAYDLIDKFTRKGITAPNLFITATDYAFQLPAILSNVVMIYKSTEKNGDTIMDSSFSVNSKNALYSYIVKSKNKDLTERYREKPLTQSWVSPFMVLAGLSCRTIKSLCSYPQTLAILQHINENYGVMTPDALYDAMMDLAKKPILLPRDEIHSRYCAIDLDYQLKLYREMPESVEFSFLSDLNDPQALYQIVSTYFNGANTIDLGKL
jgi:hypothetical protein